MSDSKKKNYTEVELNLDNDLLFWLFMRAHKMDITLNKCINNIFAEIMNELEAADVMNRIKAKDKKSGSNKRRR